MSAWQGKFRRRNVPASRKLSAPENANVKFSGTSAQQRSAFGRRRSTEEWLMQFESFSFGSIQIDGITYEHDVVIDRGEVRKRKKKPSKQCRDAYGHTPPSVEEKIPWKCRRLVIGTGTGALPVMDQVKQEAQRRKIELVIAPTVRAIQLFKQQPADTNAI